MVSGLLNQHPREAIEWLEGPKRDDFVAFYDYMME
jgi:4-hydroxy 2-oxovalerate aldolase